MSMTKKEIKSQLEKYNVEFSEDMTKEELLDLLSNAKKDIPQQPEEEKEPEKPKGPTKKGQQATLAECNRQLNGKHPFKED